MVSFFLFYLFASTPISISPILLRSWRSCPWCGWRPLFLWLAGGRCHSLLVPWPPLYSISHSAEASKAQVALIYLSVTSVNPRQGNTVRVAQPVPSWGDLGYYHIRLGGLSLRLFSHGRALKRRPPYVPPYTHSPGRCTWYRRPKSGPDRLCCGLTVQALFCIRILPRHFSMWIGGTTRY